MRNSSREEAEAEQRAEDWVRGLATFRSCAEKEETAKVPAREQWVRQGRTRE